MKNKTLILNNIHITDSEQYSTIFFEFELDGKHHSLWYKIDKKYKKYLCDDRCDSFVVSFLIFAMKNSIDIQSSYQISEKLYYQLTYHLIPQIFITNKDKCSKIYIIAEIIYSFLCLNDKFVR